VRVDFVARMVAVLEVYPTHIVALVLGYAPIYAVQDAHPT